MLGILLVSHGNLAEGLLSSAKMFFGDDIKQIDTLSLHMQTSIDDFKEELERKVAKLDAGDGVLILADLFGGTPANQSILLQSDRVHVISGANLTMLVEVLGMREGSGPIDFAELARTGQNGIIYTNALSRKDSEDDDSFLD